MTQTFKISETENHPALGVDCQHRGTGCGDLCRVLSFGCP